MLMLNIADTGDSIEDVHGNLSVLLVSKAATGYAPQLKIEKI